MRTPIYVRPLADAELAALHEGLHSSDAFTLRRCQIVLASARLQHPPEIALHLGCGEQTVRNALHDFNARGLAALQRTSSRPKTVSYLLDEAGAARLRALLHQSPRT